MRAREFLREDGEESGAQGSESTGGQLKKMHSDAIPSMSILTKKPSHYYDFYRLGVHMGASPDEQKMDYAGAVANNMAFVAYSDADAEIINKSAKDLGLDLKAISSRGSTESEGTHRVSPHRNPGNIKRISK
jgi:hypothetical protein